MNMLRALAREQGIGGIVRIKKGVSIQGQYEED